MSSEAKGAAGFPPVTYFYGEDSFLMEKEVAECIGALVDEDSRPFDLEILFADEAGPDDVADSANRLPFMSGKRVVILKRMEKWNWNRIVELTETYLSDPSPDTCLILCYGAKPDPQKKYLKNLEKHAGLSRAFSPTGNRTLVSWVENYFRQRGVALEPGAANTVVDYLGADLHRLKGELQKIELFHAGSDGPVTVRRLEELLKRVALQPVFDLGPMLGRDEKGAAMRLLLRLLDSGEDAIKLLGLLAHHYRQLTLARAVNEKGGGPADLEPRLAMAPWLAKRLSSELVRELRSTSDAQLASSFPHLAWADAYLKRSDRTLTSAVMVALATRLLG